MTRAIVLLDWSNYVFAMVDPVCDELIRSEKVVEARGLLVKTINEGLHTGTLPNWKPGGKYQYTLQQLLGAHVEGYKMGISELIAQPQRLLQNCKLFPRLQQTQLLATTIVVTDSRKRDRWKTPRLVVHKAKTLWEHYSVLFGKLDLSAQPAAADDQVQEATQLVEHAPDQELLELLAQPAPPDDQVPEATQLDEHAPAEEGDRDHEVLKPLAQPAAADSKAPDALAAQQQQELQRLRLALQNEHELLKMLVCDIKTAVKSIAEQHLGRELGTAGVKFEIPGLTADEAIAAIAHANTASAKVGFRPIPLFIVSDDTDYWQLRDLKCVNQIRYASKSGRHLTAADMPQHYLIKEALLGKGRDDLRDFGTVFGPVPHGIKCMDAAGTIVEGDHRREDPVQHEVHAQQFAAFDAAVNEKEPWKQDTQDIVQHTLKWLEQFQQQVPTIRARFLVKMVWHSIDPYSEWSAMPCEMQQHCNERAKQVLDWARKRDRQRLRRLVSTCEQILSYLRQFVTSEQTATEEDSEEKHELEGMKVLSTKGDADVDAMSKGSPAKKGKGARRAAQKGQKAADMGKKLPKKLPLEILNAFVSLNVDVPKTNDDVAKTIEVLGGKKRELEEMWDIAAVEPPSEEGPAAEPEKTLIAAAAEEEETGAVAAAGAVKNSNTEEAAEPEAVLKDAAESEPAAADSPNAKPNGIAGPEAAEANGNHAPAVADEIADQPAGHAAVTEETEHRETSSADGPITLHITTTGEIKMEVQE